MFNPRSTRSPTPAGLPLGYFCMNVQSALHAEPDAYSVDTFPVDVGMFNPRSTRSPTIRSRHKREISLNVQSALHAEPDSKNSQSLVCLYSFITAYFTGFCKHPTHTKRL